MENLMFFTEPVYPLNDGPFTPEDALQKVRSEVDLLGAPLSYSRIAKMGTVTAAPFFWNDAEHLAEAVVKRRLNRLYDLRPGEPVCEALPVVEDLHAESREIGVATFTVRVPDDNSDENIFDATNHAATAAIKHTLRVGGTIATVLNDVHTKRVTGRTVNVDDVWASTFHHVIMEDERDGSGMVPVKVDARLYETVTHPGVAPRNGWMLYGWTTVREVDAK